MHATTTCQIVFTADIEKLEAATDYLDKMQRGEYFFDEEGESLVLSLEEDMNLTCKDDIIKFVEKLYKKTKSCIDIYALGTFNALDSDSHQMFECHINNNFFRYRETDWMSDLYVSEDLSYEEFEEENYVDMDEDEYDEYVHRAHEGIKKDDGEMFGSWEYID